MDLILTSLVFLISLIPLLARGVAPRPRMALLLGAAALATAGAYLADPRARESRSDDLPAKVQDERFATSDTCLACHPRHYSTWRRTYHRTMTQPPTRESVLAPFDDVRLEHRGRTYLLDRRGEAFWVDMIDPTWELSQAGSPEPLSSAPRMRQRVVMTTGSHHLQAYWVRASHGNGMLLQVPWVYMIAECRWIPAADSFLKPAPTGPVEIEVWNTTCIDCHAVAGQPRMRPDDGTMFSRAAELGISCEACHGPAEDHVRAHRSPWSRYRLHRSGAPDPTIVHPERLSSRAASQICGQCHSVSGPLESGEWERRGKIYRAGEDLESSRRIVRYTERPQEPWIVAWLRRDPDALTGRFWGDGTVRVAGREYNGLIESACFQRGALSCLSCHSMHASDPRDQIKSRMEGDEACFPCHDSYRARITQHTHHRSGSSGSLCYNCHMPFTTYGLFVAMRSHRIDNPSVPISIETGRPNACNLCHLDKPLAWTAEYMTKWYGAPPARLAGDEKTTSAAVVWLLRGDAAQRAVTAWGMGWGPAQEISGTAWMAPILAAGLEDPYSAVRFVTHRSLRSLPGFSQFPYDFLATETERRRAREDALRLWERTRSRAPTRAGREVLLDEQGSVMQESVDRLLRMRDNRAIRIIE